jgi:hypothetical protein
LAGLGRSSSHFAFAYSSNPGGLDRTPGGSALDGGGTIRSRYRSCGALQLKLRRFGRRLQSVRKIGGS